jgi:colanic acid biosynthesis glycosyl transferase WcaI
MDTRSPTTLSPLRFVFFGGGKRLDEVAKYADAHPEAGIELHDYAPADQLLAHLQSADVHLASLEPAWSGTMVPSKLQGIFAAARPVIFIGSAESSIGRWVLESGGGWVVAAGDVAGLLAALEQASDPVERATRGRAAKVFAGENFDQRRNVARVAAILTAP